MATPSSPDPAHYRHDAFFYPNPKNPIMANGRDEDPQVQYLPADSNPDLSVLYVQNPCRSIPSNPSQEIEPIHHTVGVKVAVAYCVPILGALFIIMIEAHDAFVQFHAFQALITTPLLYLLTLSFIWNNVLFILALVMIHLLLFYVIIMAILGQKVKIYGIGAWAEERTQARLAATYLRP